MSDQPTTAQYLGTFWRELIAQGFSEDVATMMTRDALLEIAKSEGICVAAEVMA